MPETLGSRLRNLRQERGLSLREVGRRAGLSASFVRLVELDQTRISADRLTMLTAVFGVDVGDALRSKPIELAHFAASESECTDERRRAISAAAIDLLADRSRGDADEWEELSSLTGESPADIRSFFESHVDLLRGAVELAARLTREEIQRRWRDSDDAWRRLDEMLAVLIPSDEGTDLILLLWLEMLGRARSEPALASSQEAIYRATVGLYRRVIERGQGEGTIPTDCDATLAAWQLAALVDGLSLQIVAGSRDLDAAQVKAIVTAAARDLVNHGKR